MILILQQELMGNQIVSSTNEGALCSEQLLRVQGEVLRTSVLHRPICALTFVDKEGNAGFGSAVLVSENLVLTAASNIFNRKLRAENSEFRVFVGVDGVTEDYFEVEGWRYPKEFESCWEGERLQYDYAIMKLREIADFEENLTIYAPCPLCVSNKQLSIFGFPCAQQNYSSLDEEGTRKVLHQYGLSRMGRVAACDPTLFKIGYRISTLPGMKGCPVVMEDAIIAVHTGGEGDHNVGRIVDDTMIENLEKWAKYYGGQYLRIAQERQCPHYLIDSSVGLQDIQLSQQACLLHINLSLNYISQIDLSKCLQLKHLNLSNNQLQSIDISFNVHLTRLQIKYNALQKLDVRANAHLQQINLERNKITEIDLNNNHRLTSLFISKNRLTFIDISMNKMLQRLGIQQNSLSSVDLRNNKKLAILCLCQNRITQIDTSNNPLLDRLWLMNNNLSEIDLRSNSKLQWLEVRFNNLRLIRLCIFGKVGKERYTEWFNFSNQQSAACHIELSCEDETVREKAVEIADHWRKKYSSKPAYSFTVL